MKLLDKLLENPAIKTSYVTAVFTAVDTTVNVLNKVMPHLLTVQGIDPNARPGSALAKLFNKAFEPKHEEDFDEDFNFGPALKAFDKTAKKLSHLNITAKQFKELTDLDNLTTKREPTLAEANAKRIAEKTGTPTVVETAYPITARPDLTELVSRIKSRQDDRRNAASVVNEMSEFVDKYSVAKPAGEIDLLEALKTLQKISHQLDERKANRLADDFVAKSEQDKADEESLKAHKRNLQAARERVKKANKGSFKRSEDPTKE